jgi:hypothetical protein
MRWSQRPETRSIRRRRAAGGASLHVLCLRNITRHQDPWDVLTGVDLLAGNPMRRPMQQKLSW